MLRGRGLGGVGVVFGEFLNVVLGFVGEVEVVFYMVLVDGVFEG